MDRSIWISLQIICIPATINAHGKFWNIDLNDHLYTLCEGPLQIAITPIVPFGKPTFEAPTSVL
jgi:hypothetical protein